MTVPLPGGYAEHVHDLDAVRRVGEAQDVDPELGGVHQRTDEGDHLPLDQRLLGGGDAVGGEALLGLQERAVDLLGGPHRYALDGRDERSLLEAAGVKTERSHGTGVEQTQMPGDVMQAQRTVGAGGVQLLECGITAFRQLRGVVVAGIHPSALGCGGASLRYGIQERAHVACVPKGELQQGHGVCREVPVGVDEPGHEGPPAEVADLRTRVSGSQLVRLPDGDDPAVLGDDGLRRPVGHGYDVSAEEQCAHEGRNRRPWRYS